MARNVLGGARNRLEGFQMASKWPETVQKILKLPNHQKLSGRFPNSQARNGQRLAKSEGCEMATNGLQSFQIARSGCMTRNGVGLGGQIFSRV